MDLIHFDLNLLRSLDVLLEERNVTRAAERLFVTQQAASGALQRLRQDFGDELLTRVGRHLEPTPLAKSLVIPVRETLLAAQAALDTRPTFDAETSQATCRIAMSDYCLLVVLPRFLRLLNVRAPKIRCNVEALTKDSFERLSMGELDFVLAADDARLFGAHRPGKRLRSEAMFEDDFVCVVDPAKVDVSRGISLKTYRRLRHNSVAFGEGVATIVEMAWAASTFEYDVAVTAPSFSALIFMLPGTALIATAQRRLANTLAPRLGLVVTECPMKTAKLRENLLWHERTEQDPTHRFLREVLEAAVAELDVKATRSHKRRL
jgi:LysR family transcriptional regulator, nod-box dependent transcriptional activator